MRAHQKERAAEAARQCSRCPRPAVLPAGWPAIVGSDRFPRAEPVSKIFPYEYGLLSVTIGVHRDTSFRFETTGTVLSPRNASLRPGRKRALWGLRGSNGRMSLAANRREQGSQKFGIKSR
jgi:hypothetical protein